MKETKLQCQGLSCPQPVLQCKEAIERDKPTRLYVVVDNEAAKQNVSRFLQSQNYNIMNIEENDGQIAISAQSSTETIDQKSSFSESAIQTQFECYGPQIDQQLVFISSYTLGHGDDHLGMKLMQNFISTLGEMGNSLWRIILINSGVKLAIQGSPVLDKLKELENSGVYILVCGTCLDHFQLLEKKMVGETTNMLDVVTSLQLASKVIKL